MIVVVLGMHASGTSLVSKLLIEAGVRMGDKFMGPMKGVPTWEDQDFVRLNAHILQRAGGNWSHVPDEDRIWELRDDPDIARRVSTLIDKKSTYPTWGWKDPRQCLTMPVYLDHLRDVLYVHVSRDPVDVARSILARGPSKVTLEDWIHIWYTYEMRVWHILTATSRPALHFRFEGLIDKERAPECIAQLCHWIPGPPERFDKMLAAINFRQKEGS
jgi:hypothetical protein